MSAEKFNEIDPAVAKEELISVYPTKVARKRSKHIVIRGDEEKSPEIEANVRTVPGIITQRGCTYAGCKGVVMGPTRDIINITHGPIGCGFYSWLTRRNQTRPESDTDPNFMTYCFSTDMQESDIVYGGEKKLRLAIQEAYEIFKPKAICVFSTCPVGLIGDDVHSIARESQEKYGIPVVAFSCEGYKGVSQSAGHHIANNELFKNVIGTKEKKFDAKYRINIMGEYNIGGDAFEIERIMKKCGIEVIETFSGNSTWDGFSSSHNADLNTVMCHRSINYVAEMMEKKYGIPWIKINFIGADATSKSLRKIANYFGDKELIDKVEKVIAEEIAAVTPIMKEIRSRCEGKSAMLFVGGSRAHHYQELFKEMGMVTIAAGYEFGHRDDYEGTEVLPTIKVDADSRNIEELTVEPDPELYSPRVNEKEIAKLKERGVEFNDYDGMIPEMDKKAIVIDDISQFETDKLIELYKPSVFCAGIKEKYAIQKMGIPLKQLHSYDYGGPYAGYKGAVNFYNDIDRMVNTKVWSFIKAPWQSEPELSGRYANG
jgi:nitrogenase molybdenum-iron protein alpha chain